MNPATEGPRPPGSKAGARERPAGTTSSGRAEPGGAASPSGQPPASTGGPATEPPSDALGPGAGSRKRPPRNYRRDAGSVIRPAVGLFTIFLVWEAVVRIFQLPRYLLIGPIEAISEFFLRPEYYWEHTLVTLYEAALGFGGGLVLGIVSGLLIYYLPVLRSTVYPSLIAANTIPKVALAPLFVVWFGFGTTSKAMVALAIAFFPIVVSTVDGVGSVPAELRELAKINKASRWQRFRKIDFIYALPAIFTGMKISISMAVGGAVVGEFIAGRTGLGYIIMIANNMINLAAMFAAFIALAALAGVCFLLISFLGKVLLPWAEHRDG